MLWRSNPSEWWDNRRSEVTCVVPLFADNSLKAIWASQTAPKCQDIRHESKKQDPIRIQSKLAALVQAHKNESPAPGPREYNEERKRRRQEMQWREFFGDPSQWWDNRMDKKSPNHPDFRHKTKNGALCIHSRFKPSWVDSKLADLVINDGFTRQQDVSSGLASQTSNCTCSWLECKDCAEVLRGFCEGGKLKEAMDALDQMGLQGIAISMEAYECLLQGCVKMRSIAEAKRLHAHIVNRELECNRFLGNSLVSVFVKCGSLSDALQVFNRLSQRTTSSWTAIISGYLKCAKYEDALQMYREMLAQGVKPNKYTFARVLKACSTLGDLEEGKRIHAEAVRRGCELDYFTGTALVGMYAKCGDMEGAQSVFGRLPECDVVSWNEMIAGYVQQEQGDKALQLYYQMQEVGVLPNSWIFVSILKACGSLAAVEEATIVSGQPIRRKSLQTGVAIHADIQKMGHESDVFVGNTLVHMYAKCGSIVDARRVFDLLVQRDLVSWNALITVYAEHGQIETSLELYARMQEEGVCANDRIFVSMLRAYGNLASSEQETLIDGQLVKVECLQKVKAIHAQVLQSSYGSDAYISNTLMDVYARCGSIVDARNVFNTLSSRDVVSWNAMITAYAKQGEGDIALRQLDEMRREGVIADSRTFISAIKACSSVAGKGEVMSDDAQVKLHALRKVKAIHSEVIQSGYGSHRMISNTLIHMYAECGSLGDARLVFDTSSDRDVVSWNAMIAGYAEHEQGEQALQLFTEMQKESVMPDSRTFVSTLKACSSLAVLEKDEVVNDQLVKAESLAKGKGIHMEVCRHGYESDVFVVNSLIHMYATCGSVTHSRHVFDSSPKRDVVSWNTMIAGYAKQDEEVQAIQLYIRMKEEGVTPNEATFLCILKACSNVGALKMCTQVHQDIIKSGIVDSVNVASSLIHAYGKCGHMREAHHLFNRLGNQDLVTWNGLIAGHARHGDWKMSLLCFEEMQGVGVKPDGVTFTCLFTACSHAGMVQEGLQYFKRLVIDRGVATTMQHYSCIVDLLGRAGFLSQAEELMLHMPVQPELAIWLSLLGACRKHGNVELGKRAFQCAVSLEPDKSAAYILMSNIYARAGMWEEAIEMDQLRRRVSGKKTKLGKTWIEYGDRMHVFAVGGRNLNHGELLWSKLTELSSQLLSAKAD